MIPNYASVSETIESTARCIVEVRGYPGRKAWTVERTIWCGAIMSFKVEFWDSRERKVVPPADVQPNHVAIPPPPAPWWSDPAADLPERLPSNVVYFPLSSMSNRVAGGLA